jgi:hypothetical protein
MRAAKTYFWQMGSMSRISITKIKKQLNRHYSPYPHCSEPNKLTSKFCNNCQMVLAFDAFNETIKDAEERKKEREEIKAQLKILTASKHIKSFQGFEVAGKEE